MGLRAALIVFFSRVLIRPLDRWIMAALLPPMGKHPRLKRNLSSEEYRPTEGAIVRYDPHLDERNFKPNARRFYHVNLDLETIFKAPKPPGLILIENGRFLRENGYRLPTRFSDRVLFLDDLPDPWNAVTSLVFIAIVSAILLGISNVEISLLSVLVGLGSVLLGSFVVKSFERSAIRALDAQRTLLEMMMVGDLSERCQNLLSYKTVCEDLNREAEELALRAGDSETQTASEKAEEEAFSRKKARADLRYQREKDTVLRQLMFLRDSGSTPEVIKLADDQLQNLSINHFQYMNEKQ